MSAHGKPLVQASAGAPIVYVGPSLSPSVAAELLPQALIRPPVARGDLYRDREAGGALFVVIDGVFLQELAVSPREVVDVARDGALIVGASSMGALRGAECWPVGVRGVGRVYRAFRMGVLQTDDEVAVATDPDGAFRAVSVALVNVRCAVSRAVRKRLLDRQQGRRIVDAAVRMFFPERQWRSLLREAGIADGSGELLRFLSAQDVKREDAVHALEYTAALLREGDVFAKHARVKREPFVRPNRQSSQLYFGRSPEELRGELVEWLFGTGRYERYLWPVLSGSGAFQGVPEDGRSERLRELLCDVLARRLPADDALAGAVWEELQFVGELRAEVARMYSARRLAQEAGRASVDIDPQILQRVQAEVSIAHGARQWSTLVENVFDGRFCGAIPFEWIERSCRMIAHARSFVKHLSRAEPTRANPRAG